MGCSSSKRKDEDGEDGDKKGKKPKLRKMDSMAQLVVLLSAMVLAPAGAFHSLPGVPRLRVAAGPQRGGALVVWQAGPAHSTPRRKAKLFLALHEGEIDWAALEPLVRAAVAK